MRTFFSRISLPRLNCFLYRLAYRAGVASGIVAPSHRGFAVGLSTTFATGALHKLESGAVLQDVNALHVSVKHHERAPSVSTQIGTLRRLLLEPDHRTDAGRWFGRVSEVGMVHPEIGNDRHRNHVRAHSLYRVK